MVLVADVRGRRRVRALLRDGGLLANEALLIVDGMICASLVSKSNLYKVEQSSR